MDSTQPKVLCIQISIDKEGERNPREEEGEGGLPRHSRKNPTLQGIQEHPRHRQDGETRDNKHPLLQPGALQHLNGKRLFNKLL